MYFTFYKRPFGKREICLTCPPNPEPEPVEHPQPPRTYVAYYRVSTARQGASGLGLSAQRTGVSSFLRGRGRVLAEFTDVESGRRNDRPELMRAIARCKAEGAVLLIAKLDRLTRNVAFIFALRDSGAEFVCADMPEANTLTIGVMATMAQHDRAGVPEGGHLRPHEKGAGREEEAGLDAGHPGQPDAGGGCEGDGRSTAKRPRRREQPPGGGAGQFHAGVRPRLDGHRRRAQRLRFPHQEGRGVPARAGQARGGPFHLTDGFVLYISPS